jgi:hypothetical protein
MKRFFMLMTVAATAAWFAGCGSQDAATEGGATTGMPSGSSADSDEGDSKEGSHSHGEGPHGGTLADWGGGTYHVEFTVDHDKKEATVYIIGDDAKTPAPIAAESIQLSIDDPATEMELAAAPLEGEADGVSSRFVGTHDTIGVVKEFSGTISGEIDGTPYTGEFKEEPHTEH